MRFNLGCRKSLVRRATHLALAVSLLAASETGSAQTPVVRPERLPEPGKSIVTTDDSTALSLNPANLSWTPGSELRWSGIFLNEDLAVPWQGHAISYATRLPLLNVPMGLRLDLVAPPNGLDPARSTPYQWLTWGFSTRAGERSTLGASVQTSFSNGGFADNLTSFTLAYSNRPADAVAISLVARDLNAPSNDVGKLGRSYEGGLLLRPLGTRAWEIGLESRYLELEDVWIPRATLGIDLPSVGRLRGDFALSDPTRESRAWLASAGLSVYLNPVSGSADFAGGAITGNGSGQNGSFNPYASFATRSFRAAEGFEPGRYAVRIRVESTPGARAHVSFLRQLWSLSKESKVDAVVFELKTSPGESLARLQELRDAVFELRRAGKRTLCHLEGASGASLYFCSATNRTLINPAGGVRFSGLRSRHIFLSRVLENLGIRAEFIRIGAHKGAPEQFTEKRATDVGRADKIDLLQQYERQFSAGIAVGRGLTVEAVRERLAQGPFVSQEAKAAGLVDDLAFDDEIEKAVRDLTGRPTSLSVDRRRRKVPETFGNEGHIALVYLNGDMIDGRSRSVPFLGMQVAGSYTLAETLKAVRENKRIKAVVIRVETPGGSSMAADVIWRQVKLTAKAKPTIVSMGSVAASGGYYISAPADRIFANPLTVTGSIGIFYGKADVSQLLNRIGVDVEVYKTHPRADAESFFRPFTPSERKVLEGKVAQFYRTFVERVAEGRRLSYEAVDKVAQGRVWTGEQALANGLVDELGGLRQAIEYARKKSGLSDQAGIIELPAIKRSLVSQLLGVEGLRSSLLDTPMPSGMSKTLRALGPFVIHPGDRPLARLEFVLDNDVWQ